MTKKFMYVCLFILYFLFVGFKNNDSEQKEPPEKADKGSSCESCHTNKKLLKKIAKPLPESGKKESGEG